MNGGHSLGFGVAACLALCIGCDDEGELAIIVTTDMAVPADFDKLVWGIRFSSETSQTNELPIRTEFPLLLGVIGGPQSNEPVTVFVEGHREDSKRVEREAKVLLDRSKVKELEMPLEWICSAANPVCAGGTCTGGHCAAPTETWTPTDYRERRTEACFPVSTCFEGKKEQFYDSSCEISVPNAESLNFAIGFPRTPTSGLSGFCNDALTECLIPLDRIDPAERLTSGERVGWHLKPGARAVVLSQAICDQKHHIYSTPVAGSCPQKSRFVPTCEPRPLCREQEDACPRGFALASKEEPEPNAPRWLGYVCRGREPPRDGLVDCHPGETNPDATVSSWCCRTGARFFPAEMTQGNPLLIDDMAGGSTVKLGARDDDRGDAMAGAWFTAPIGSEDVSPKPGTIFGYRDFKSPEPRADARLPPQPPISRAACLSSTNGFMGHVAMAGFNFRVRASGGYGALDFDVSRYDGFSFWAKNRDAFGASLELDVHVPNVQTATDDPACCRVNGDSSRCDDFQKSVTLTQDWKFFEVRWEDLKQSKETWDPPQQRFEVFDPRAYGVSFAVQGGGPTVRSQPFDFCVADIRFIQTSLTNPQRFKVDPRCPPKPQPDDRLR